MKQKTKLINLTTDYIPKIENYPLPRVGKQRRVVNICFEGKPVSASVGFSGNKLYRSQDYTAYRDALAWLIKEKIGGEWDTRRYSFGVRVRFFLAGMRKIDIDNLVKPVLDAATGLIWADDSQVIELYAVKLMKQKESKIEFLVYHIGDWIDYHHLCAYCGKDIARKGLSQKYCSIECRDKDQRKATERQCPECGKTFWNGRYAGIQKRIVSKQKFCSRQCFNIWMKKHGKEWKEHFKKL